MSSLLASRDSDIRHALHRVRLRRHHSNPSTLVVDELGLAHAKCRVDVAVIRRTIHGYEIKSGMDTLSRLRRQLSVYEKTLEELTFVTDEKHIPELNSEIPEWCGLIVAEKGPRGGMRLNSFRRAELNPYVDPVMLAHLLWKTEALELLSGSGYSSRDLRRPRKQLYEMLSEVLTLKEITLAIREFMGKRPTWRDLQVPA